MMRPKALGCFRGFIPQEDSGPEWAPDGSPHTLLLLDPNPHGLTVILKCAPPSGADSGRRPYRRAVTASTTVGSYRSSNMETPSDLRDVDIMAARRDLRIAVAVTLPAAARRALEPCCMNAGGGHTGPPGIVPSRPTQLLARQRLRARRLHTGHCYRQPGRSGRSRWQAGRCCNGRSARPRRGWRSVASTLDPPALSADRPPVSRPAG